MNILSSVLIFFILIYLAKANRYQFIVDESHKEIDSSGLEITVEFSRHRSKSKPRDLRFVTCKIYDAAGTMWWAVNGTTNITDPVNDTEKSNFTIVKSVELTGDNASDNLTCVFNTTDGVVLTRTVEIRGIEPGKMTSSNFIHHVKVNESVTLACFVKGYPMSNFEWDFTGNPEGSPDWTNLTKLTHVNESYVIMSIEFKNVKRSNEGTYICLASDYYNHRINSFNHLMVADAPKVELKIAQAVARDTVHLNFDVDNSRDTTKNMIVQFIKNGSQIWLNSTPTNIGSSSYLVGGLEASTEYKFKTVFSNSLGSSDTIYSDWVTTMIKNPEFIPTVQILATTLNSVSIEWSAPPKNLESYIRHYNAMCSRDEKAVTADEPNFTFENLDPETNYSFKVQACNFYTRNCGDWSSEKEATTLDRDPKFVPNVSIKASTLESLTINWSVPQENQILDNIHQYKVMANHREDIRGPIYLPKTVDSYVFENLESKTSYLIKVAACSDYRTQCGNWSDETEGFTLETEKEIQVTTIWPIAISIVTVTLIIIVTTWFSVRRRRKKALKKKLMEAASQNFYLGAVRTLNPELNICDQAELLPYNKKWEFPRELLKLDKILGSGAFGIVRKARAKSICRPDIVTTVAVKLVRATARLNYMTALTRELKILGYLGKHPNVVNLLGACTMNVSYGELMVIVEFCRFGNLRDYLIHRREDFNSQIDPEDSIVEMTAACSSSTADDTADSVVDGKNSSDQRIEIGDSVPKVEVVEPIRRYKYEGDYGDENLNPIGVEDLMCWSWQVSRGMKYLGTRRIIHGDLAARNILLADNNVVKICDFGMAKALYKDDDYKMRGLDPLPVKWMAIETLRDRVFSVQSDIWSFGVVLWEFFTLGETPYPGMAPENVYQRLVDGFRLPKPKHATVHINHLMRFCWAEKPRERPAFQNIEDSIAQLLDDSVKTRYIDLSALYVRMNKDAAVEGEIDYLTMTPPTTDDNSTKKIIQQKTIDEFR